MMDELIKITIILHATAGGISLLSGLTAIFSRKGSPLHKTSGKIYYWGMLLVVTSGLIVGAYKGNIFIQTIAVFSFYMVFTGRRVLRFKKAIIPTALDWVFNFSSMATALGMLSLAIYKFSVYGFRGMAPVLLVFGLLLLIMVLQDYKKLKTKRFVKNAWLFDHISRMGGSYIATVTAFLVVNVYFEPQWIMWLLPTVVGTAMLFRASAIWRKKLSN